LRTWDICIRYKSWKKLLPNVQLSYNWRYSKASTTQYSPKAYRTSQNEPFKFFRQFFITTDQSRPLVPKSYLWWPSVIRPSQQVELLANRPISNPHLHWSKIIKIGLTKVQFSLKFCFNRWPVSHEVANWSELTECTNSRSVYGHNHCTVNSEAMIIDIGIENF